MATRKFLQPLSKPNSLGRTMTFSLPRGLPKHGGCCPNAGKCLAYCYGKKGRFVFKNVTECHKRNLAAAKKAGGSMLFLKIDSEIRRMRKPLRCLRIHSVGDFWSQDYLDLWVWLAEMNPTVLFYCYTTSIDLDWEAFDALDNTNRVVSLGARGGRLQLIQYADEHGIATCEVWPKHMGPVTPQLNEKDGSHDDAVAATAKAGDRIIIKEH